MRLHDLRATSAFRLTLLFSALLFGSVLLLFGFVYWRSAVFLGERFDNSLLSEAREVEGTPPEGQKLTLENLIASDPRLDWHAGLFGADRSFLAGNIREWPQGIIFDGKSRNIRHHQRGLGLVLQDGNFLIIARRADELHEISELLLRALAGGLVASLALALFGGLVMSSASLRRIEAMHRAAAEIMEGDLAKRLPVAGSGDDFDRLAGIVNAMLAEIERLVGDIKAAGDNIAHDLRTPLTRLRTRLEGALRRGGAVEQHRAAMEDALADADSILATFRALLRISEVEAGARRAGFTEVDLVKLANSAAEFFEPLAAERGIAFAASIDATAPVKGDPDLLFEALANLLDNAVKFTPSGGTVLLTLTPDGEIAVADSGPGLPDGVKDALMQRFVRGDKSRHLPGNGLGLSLVAAVMRLHGFAFDLQNSRPGCRAVITTVPAAKS
jgi:signal transduction histidine kinase